MLPIEIICICESKTDAHDQQERAQDYCPEMEPEWVRVKIEIGQTVIAQVKAEMEDDHQQNCEATQGIDQREALAG